MIIHLSLTRLGLLSWESRASGSCQRHERRRVRLSSERSSFQDDTIATLRVRSIGPPGKSRMA